MSLVDQQYIKRVRQNVVEGVRTDKQIVGRDVETLPFELGLIDGARGGVLGHVANVHVLSE